MKLVHATSRDRVERTGGIRQCGLKRKYAVMKRKAIWCVPEGNMDVAHQHIAKKRVPLSQIVFCFFEVPDSWLRAHGDGSYYIDRDIPASMIRLEAIFRGGI